MKQERERGAATLAVTVIIMLLLLIIVGFMAKMGILEIKSSSSINRAKEAQNVAQAGLDYTAINFEHDNDYAGASGALPGGGTYSTSVTETADYILISSKGNTADAEGTDTLQEKYGYVPVVGFGELPPLMANGSFEPAGGITIIANPNGGGDGVAVSAWVESVDLSTGSFQTCERDEYLYRGDNDTETHVTYDLGNGEELVTCPNCTCNVGVDILCKKDMTLAQCKDVVVDSPVPDTFETVFSETGDNWDIIYNAAKKVDCADLDANIGDSFYGADGNLKSDSTLPVVWVETPGAECALHTQVGSPDAPIILVIHGDIKMNAGAAIFGILFSFADIYTASETVDFQVNGNAIIYGSAVANTDVNLANGSHTIYYAPVLLDKLSNNGDGVNLLGRRSGSWNDLQ